MQFPEFQTTDFIAFDLETFDPGLRTVGCGAMRNHGHILSVGLACGKDTWYFRMNEANRPKLVEYLRDLFSSGVTLIGANLQYDIMWAQRYGFWSHEIHRCAQGVNFKSFGRLYDVLTRATLIDETAQGSYNLNAQCKLYGLDTKPDEPIYSALEAIAAKDGSKLKYRKGEDFRKYLYLLVDTEYEYLLESYQRHDCRQTLKVFEAQQPIIERLGLQQVDQLESFFLAPISLMQYKGLPVCEEIAHDTNNAMLSKVGALLKEIKEETGLDSVASSYAFRDFISEEWARVNMPESIPQTDKGTDKTDKKTLAVLASRSEVVKKIIETRKLQKLQRDYIAKPLQMAYKSRVYPSIWPVASDTKGSRFGRMSYSRPALQQSPKRDGENAKLCRDIYREKGKVCLSADYSNQEPRWMVELAYQEGLPGAADMLRAYQDDPTMSQHVYVARRMFHDPDFSAEKRPTEYAIAKAYNLGTSYEMGPRKMYEQHTSLFKDLEEVYALGREYHQAMPHIKAFSNSANEHAAVYGYVCTIMGRRANFNKYHPARRGKIEEAPLDRDAAIAKWGPAVTRAFTYRAGNRRVQGSASDQTKAAVCKMYYYHNLITDLIVHDEADIFIDESSLYEVGPIVKDSMVTAIPSTVPFVVNMTAGPSWGTQTIKL